MQDFYYVLDIKVARQRGVKKIGVGMKGRIEVYHIMVVAQHLSLGIDRVLAGIDRVLAGSRVIIQAYKETLEMRKYKKNK